MTLEQSIDDVMVNKTPRTVQFSETVKIHYVPTISEMTNGQTTDVWYSEKENVIIRRNILKTIIHIRKGKVNKEKYCGRGLEHVITETHQKWRASMKQLVINAVLQEQRAQVHSQSPNRIDICNASSVHSEWAKTHALLQARSDALFAKEAMQSSARGEGKHQ